MTKKRRKIEPLDMVEKTNIKQHNAMIGALNDLVDDFDALDLMPGPQGIKGEKGDKGDKGDIGLRGEKGEKGDKGDMGPRGYKGVQGDKGDTGPQGPKGEKGDKGDRGERGAPGIIENVTYESVQGLPDMLDTLDSSISTHASNKSNPHSVTKAQVGLGAYPASPADIGISTATQTALDRTVKTTGNEVIEGFKTFIRQIDIETGRLRLKQPDGAYADIDAYQTADKRLLTTLKMNREVEGVLSQSTVMDWRAEGASIYTMVPMRASPGASDVVNTKYVLDRVSEIVGYVDDDKALLENRITELENRIALLEK